MLAHSRAVTLIKKGQLVLLRNMGTDKEEQVRMVGQHESFGPPIESLLEMEDEVTRHSHGNDGVHALLRQHALESARATTYCDVVELRMSDFVKLLEDDFAQHRSPSDVDASDPAQATLWGRLRAADVLAASTDADGDGGYHSLDGGALARASAAARHSALDKEAVPDVASTASPTPLRRPHQVAVPSPETMGVSFCSGVHVGGSGGSSSEARAPGSQSGGLFA